jgi:hypothetical protein
LIGIRLIIHEPGSVKSPPQIFHYFIFTNTLLKKPYSETIILLMPNNSAKKNRKHPQSGHLQTGAKKHAKPTRASGEASSRDNLPYDRKDHHRSPIDKRMQNDNPRQSYPNNPARGSQKPLKRRQRRIREDNAPPPETPWKSADFYAALQTPYGRRREGTNRFGEERTSYESYGNRKKPAPGRPNKGKPRHR